MPGKTKENRNGPELDKYIRIEKRYTTYLEASRFYSMPYYRLIRLAKEANACWKIPKTAIVDLDKLDEFMENYKDEGNDQWELKEHRTVQKKLAVNQGWKKEVCAPGATLCQLAEIEIYD